MASDNQEQAEYWNGQAGDTWVESVDQIDRILSPVTEILLDRAAVERDERVLDVGCGCGTTTIEIAERAARTWGIDLSATMIETARRRGKDAGGGMS